MRFATIFHALCISSLFVIADAKAVSVLDVYTPTVTYPTEGIVWKVGEKHNVTWDTSTPPKQITNLKGRIQLRKGDLTTPVVLANNFDIMSGTIEVKVPWVLNGDDYRIVLFGDSGDWSPPFAIRS